MTRMFFLFTLLAMIFFSSSFFVGCEETASDTTAVAVYHDSAGTYSSSDSYAFRQEDTTHYDVEVEEAEEGPSINYCQEMEDAGFCDKDYQWQSVDKNHKPLMPSEGMETARLECKNGINFNVCLVKIFSSWSPLHKTYVAGVGLPNEDHFYDSGSDSYSNEDKWNIALWFSTTQRGQPLLTLRKIGGGGGVLTFQFL